MRKRMLAALLAREYERGYAAGLFDERLRQIGERHRRLIDRAREQPVPANADPGQTVDQ